MLKITISGDRAEGKSTLAGVLETMLENLTNYEVVDVEDKTQHSGKIDEKRLRDFRRSIDMVYIRGKLNPKFVLIEVENPR